MKSQNIKFHFSFILGVYKVRLDERIPNIVTELSLNRILLLFWPKKTPKIGEIASWSIMTFFSAKIWVKYYPSLILIPYLESSYQNEHFRTQHKRKCKRKYFCLPIVFLKLHLLCANRKSGFIMRENMTLFCYSHPMAPD